MSVNVHKHLFFIDINDLVLCEGLSVGLLEQLGSTLAARTSCSVLPGQTRQKKEMNKKFLCKKLSTYVFTTQKKSEPYSTVVA